MKILKYLLFIAVTFSWEILQAQEWQKNIRSQHPKLEELQKAFEEYWENKPYERGKGYKQFKRFEWYWLQRIRPDMDFPPNDIIYVEWDKYLQMQPELDQDFSGPSNWVFKGPSTSPGGYRGLGRLNCIAFHPTNANTYWVGSPAGGIWKTTDNGRTWSTNFDKMPSLGVSSIVIDPRNTNVMYIATGDGEQAAGAYGNFYGGDSKSIGVLKSTNGGQSWNKTGLDWKVDEQKLIRKIMMDPNNSNILYAATTVGIYKTSNAGTSWSRILTGHFTDIEFKPNDARTLYAAAFAKDGQNAIYTTHDAGVNWNANITFNDDVRIELAVTPDWPELVDAISCNTKRGLEGMYYSNNGGDSWKTWFDAETEKLNFLGWSYLANDVGGQGTYDLCYVRNPNNWKHLIIGGVNAWRTFDDGASWNLQSHWSDAASQNPNQAEVVHADKHFIEFHPANSNRIFECNDGGVYESTNGGDTWTDKSNGLGISQLYKIGVSQTKPNVVICGLQDNGSKEWLNGMWFERTGGDGMDCMIDYKNDDIQYASYANGVIYRTLDHWKTSETITPQIPNDPDGKLYPGAWVSPIALDPVTPSTIYLGLKELWVSNNRGNNWFRISNLALPDEDPFILNITISQNNPRVVYVSNRHSIYKTTDGGNQWYHLGTTTSSINGIAANPNNANQLVIVYGSYEAGEKVYITNDGGSSWINLSGTLPNVPANCIIFQKDVNGAMYLGTDVGVFYRDNTKRDWELFSTNLPNVTITDLEIAYVDKKLYAATYGRGLWSSNLFNATKSNDITQAKHSILHENGLSSNIKLVCKGQGEFLQSIKIFDINGKQIYSQNGIHNRALELNHQLNSGLYFISAKTNQFYYFEKTIIIK